MLAAIAVVCVLLVLLLALPVDLAFRLESVEGFAGQVRIAWLFGLVRHRIVLPPSAGRRAPRPAIAAQAAGAPARRRRRPRRADVMAALRQAAFRRRVYRFARDLARAAHARDLGLRVRLGLGDPADTGRLWAFVGPLNAAAQNLRNADVRIEPEFVDSVLEFEARGRLQLFPLQLLALAISFALSPASIRAWRSLGRSHA